ncbi:hypothetical protein AQS8620_02151 [Aquimixticola soesokkakensis]|uniref:HTTM-like domain-containing protein n=1 Tax=Aquimixticola soesokkakensis TaxID=1519096 RepID=A0A1Y5SWI5_9RHOB|nr:HTTM domain-containing protein [Aquimixticola soesokkakensis]SLN50113.1 hypothetical protein AQS8620_02151 [Aquimixticola soesokkakensis]
MSLDFDQARRLCDLLLAVALVLQALEHVVGNGDGPRTRRLFAAQGVFSVALLGGLAPAVVLSALLITSCATLWRFNGPYNGGSDKMRSLALFALWLAHVLPTRGGQELALAYLAAQLVLSYLVSGWIKLINPDWRSGAALRDVFAYSAYPVSEGLRGWAQHPRLLWAMSWAVIGFEVLFPLTLLQPRALLWGLALAALFHAANACLFGLNRFFWAWIAAFPALIWLQARLLGL